MDLAISNIANLCSFVGKLCACMLVCVHVCMQCKRHFKKIIKKSHPFPERADKTASLLSTFIILFFVFFG